MWLVLGCVAGALEDSLPTDGADSADTDDSGDSAETGEVTDSAETGETGETGEPGPPGPTGAVSWSGTVGGVTVIGVCDAEPELYGYWVDSLGNISGSFGCTNEVGDTLSVTFIGPSEGAWEDTSEGISWAYASGSEYWSYDTEGRESWALAFTEYGWVDAERVRIAGTLGGTWSGAELLGEFDVVVGG